MTCDGIKFEFRGVHFPVVEMFDIDMDNTDDLELAHLLIIRVEHDRKAPDCACVHDKRPDLAGIKAAAGRLFRNDQPAGETVRKPAHA